MRNTIAVLLFAASLGAASSLPVFAQDSLPETPPELRDFRLDPERAQPQPQPTTTQPVTPPPAVPTVPSAEPERGRPPTGQQATPNRRQTPAPTTIAPADTSETGGDVALDTVADQSGDLPAATTDMDSAPAAASDGSVGGWLWAMMLAAALALILLGLLLVRKRKRADEGEPVTVPIMPPIPVDSRTPPVRATPAVAAKPKPKRQPVMRIDFIPEKAAISFTTLTVKGQLQLVNEGTTAATGMELRAGLLSASNEQQKAIDAFFGGEADGQRNPLEGAKPGERLAMAMELSVPLTEMQSFPLGDQRLLVPIMVASLHYRAEPGGALQETRLACMIGREANPPKAKMGPLRVDLGPRSFAPVGVRALAVG